MTKEKYSWLEEVLQDYHSNATDTTWTDTSKAKHQLQQLITEARDSERNRLYSLIRHTGGKYDANKIRKLEQE